MAVEQDRGTYPHTLRIKDGDSERTVRYGFRFAHPRVFKAVAEAVRTGDGRARVPVDVVIHPDDR